LEKSAIPFTCAIIYFDDKVLAVQRSKTMKLPLK
jgi:8-oxo-dGTP diphosphatase